MRPCSRRRNTHGLQGERTPTTPTDRTGTHPIPNQGRQTATPLTRPEGRAGTATLKAHTGLRRRHDHISPSTGQAGKPRTLRPPERGKRQTVSTPSLFPWPGRSQPPSLTSHHHSHKPINLLTWHAQDAPTLGHGMGTSDQCDTARNTTTETISADPHNTDLTSSSCPPPVTSSSCSPSHNLSLYIDQLTTVDFGSGALTRTQAP